jgi:hypothetical protein
MKVYVKVENYSNEKYQVVINCKTLIDGLKTVLQKMPKEFTKGKKLKPRIYCSEVGFESDEFKWVDIVKVMRKADFDFDE